MLHDERERPALGQRPSHGVGERAQPAGVADHDAAAQQGPRRLAQRLTLPDADDRLRVVRAGAEAVEALPGGGPAHRVGGEARVALEVDEGPLRALAEDAVDASGVETERAQPPLQRRDVVAPQWG